MTMQMMEQDWEVSSEPDLPISASRKGFEQICIFTYLPAAVTIFSFYNYAVTESHEKGNK